MRHVLGWLAAGVMFLGSGCGDGAPSAESSMTEATVAGKVTVKGKPAAKGSVTFNPSNVNRKTAARTVSIKNGAYEITTLIGANAVSVGGTGDPAAGTYNTTNFEVKAGAANQLDLDLPLNK